MAGELAKQKPGLSQRWRDHGGEAALQHRPGGIERGSCALAALSRCIEQHSRRSGEQHIPLPGIERQPRDALGPADRLVERDGLWRFKSELRSKASSRLRAAVLMRASLAGAPSHRRRLRCGTARQCVANR